MICFGDGFEKIGIFPGLSVEPPMNGGKTNSVSVCHYRININQLWTSITQTQIEHTIRFGDGFEKLQFFLDYLQNQESPWNGTKSARFMTQSHNFTL